MDGVGAPAGRYPASSRLFFGLVRDVRVLRYPPTAAEIVQVPSPASPHGPPAAARVPPTPRARAAARLRWIRRVNA